MKKIYILLSALLAIAVAQAQNVGIGTNDPKVKLDINGSLALREGPALTLVNGGASGGANDNIVLPDITTGVKAGFYRITGPTAAFSVFGIVPTTGADGQLVTLVNTTNNVMTIKNNASSTAANGFKTLTGSDMVSVAGNSSVTIQYNKTESRWYVTGSQNYVVTTGSIATGDITTSNNAVTLTNNTGRLVGNSTLTVDVKNNDLNQKGLVPGPTGGNGNQVWGTDAAGYPAWQKVNNNMLNSSSITVNNGTGVSVSGSPVALGGSITVTNTAPDQTVVLNNGTGINTTGTYPNFTITNTAPDQTVAITGGSGISATGTYPNFTIANTGDLSNTNEAQTLAGSGTNDINLTQAGGAGGGTITLQGSGATSVSRSGNTFTISSTNSGGTVTGTGTPTQVTFWNTTTGITSDANLYWDNTNKRLSIGSVASDAQTVSIRGYSNTPTNWKGSGAFGYTSAAVIIGELNGVAQIGGHSATLNAWANLALNSGGGNVGIGTTTPSERLHVSNNVRADGIVYWGNGLVRTETRDNAGLRGDAGARSGFFETSSPTNYPAGASSWWHLLDVRHSNNSNNYALQIAGSFFDQNLWFRKTNDNAAQAWTRILTTTDIPGGVLPAGSASNTLYHNGTSWVAGSNLANDGSTITLGNFSNSNTDEWPKVQWLRVGNYDEGLIKGSTARGAWGREGFGIHMHSTKHFAFYSTGWDPLFDVEGGTGRTYIKGNTGISTTTPASLLHVMGKINLHQSGAGGGQNRFEGLEAATSANGRGQFVLSSAYSDLVIASSQANDNHGSTLTFATYNPNDANDYRKFIINQGNWGARRGFLDFGFADAGGRTNPHSNINGTDNVLTLDGFNKRVGIGNMNPATRLEVASPSGNIAAAVIHSSGGQAWGNVMTLATDGCCDNPRLNFSYRNKAKHWQIGGYSSDTRFSIWEDGGDGTYGSGWGAERMTFAPGGNVGVGINTPNAKLDVSTGSDGIAMGQIHGDNTNTIQTYIDGQWANRTSYAGGCCNPLLIQPDVGTVGIGITGPAAKLHVVGNAVTGTIIAAPGNSYQTDWPGGWGGGMAGWDLCIASMRYSGLSQRSDMRLKKDIKELPATMSALDIVDRLRPVSYGYIDKRIARKVHFGFIAQEVQQILPEIVEVGTDSMQTLGMSYIDLIPILTQAVKDQQKQISELKQSSANTAPAESPKMAELQEQNRILLEKLNALTKRLEELEKKQ